MPSSRSVSRKSASVKPATAKPAAAAPAVVSDESPWKAAVQATDLRDHGIAVHKGSTLCVKPWRDAATGKDYVYVGITTFPGLVVQVHVQTGRCRQFNLGQGGVGPWGMAFTLNGEVLVTGTDGCLYRIDPRKGEVVVVAKLKQWLWTIDRAADGKFYLGGSPTAMMYRYDDATRQVEEIASFAHIDKYVRVVAALPDGYVYCSIGCEKAQIVAYHIASGKSKVLLPKSEVGPDFHGMGRGRDGKLYVRTVHGNFYRLEHGEAFPIEDESAVNREPASRWSAFALSRLPDGRAIRYLDPDAIQLGEGKGAKVIPFKYETNGAAIFHLAEGPNKNVYASTIMPLYILRYTPSTKKLENLGRGGPDNGEAYSFGHCKGKLYYATYSTGKLMEYDPAKPWNKDKPGAMKWETNPKLLGDLGEGHCRPRALTVDAKGRVWVGSHAEYGRRHGGLMCFDTKTRKMHNNPLVVPDQSIQSLISDASGDVIYGGTDICRGSGMDASTKECHLFAWDARKQKLMWSLVPIKGQTGIMTLLQHNGKLYGTSRKAVFNFFCFDPETRKMEYVIESKIDACREESMTLGPDGCFYGITYTDLFRWQPETGKVESIWHTPKDELKNHSGGSMFHRGAVINDGRFYFSCGPAVMSLKLPK
ncbi:MAG: hypothetical protein NTW19_18225 [Planctomycetota bacterium]|nr:hypothetical protein [Planctomycetota bacterium]